MFLEDLLTGLRLTQSMLFANYILINRLLLYENGAWYLVNIFFFIITTTRLMLLSPGVITARDKLYNHLYPKRREGLMERQ